MNWLRTVIAAAVVGLGVGSAQARFMPTQESAELIRQSTQTQPTAKAPPAAQPPAKKETTNPLKAPVRRHVTERTKGEKNLAMSLFFLFAGVTVVVALAVLVWWKIR